MERIITLAVRSLTEDALDTALGELRAAVGRINDLPIKSTIEFIEAPANALDRDLTPREAQVVDCVVQGISAKVIAHRLGMSEGTVKCHLNNLYRKTGSANRTQLAMWAMRNRPARQPEALAA